MQKNYLRFIFRSNFCYFELINAWSILLPEV